MNRRVPGIAVPPRGVPRVRGDEPQTPSIFFFGFGVPRVRGDEPAAEFLEEAPEKCSPRARE